MPSPVIRWCAWVGWIAIGIWLVALVVQIKVAGVPFDRQ